MPEPIPSYFVRRAASVRQLMACGLTSDELAGPLWAAPYRGVRLWSARDQAHPLTRIDATLPLLPADATLGGWAAAHLAGVPYVDGTDPDGSPIPVDHVLPPTRKLSRRSGIRHHRDRLTPAEWVQRRAFRVTAPSRTAVDMARWAPDVIEAVVALDALLHAGYVGAAGLRAQLDAMTGRPGIRRAREAFSLADPGAESPWETRLRLLWTLEAGLPPPRVNPYVVSTSGRPLGRVDLLDEAAGLVLEYDGEHHRALGQHRADNLREERLGRAGLRVIRFTVLDVLDRGSTVARLRDERAARIGRDTSRETWLLRAERPPPHPTDQPAQHARTPAGHHQGKEVSPRPHTRLRKQGVATTP